MKVILAQPRGFFAGVVRDFRQSAAPVPYHEIVAHGFFAVAALPNDTTAATRARIVEVLGGAPINERW